MKSCPLRFVVPCLTVWGSSLGVFASGGPVCVRGDTAMVVGYHPLAVSMYHRNGGRWERAQVLRCDETYEYRGNPNPIRFGEDVDLDGDTAVVGAPGRTGSVFIYRRYGEEWQLEQRIHSEDLDEHQRWLFGAAVAISGDTLVVGNCEIDTPNHENAFVYVYTRTGTTWKLQQRLENTGALPYHHFGLSLDVDGDVIVVGARDDKDPETYASHALGSVSVIRRTGEIWKLEQKIRAPDGVFRYGQSVALKGERFVVGTLHEWNERVFVYRHGAEGWTLEEELRKHDPKAHSTQFGFAVDFDGTRIAVNAPFADFTTLFTRENENDSWGFGLTFIPAPQIRFSATMGFVSVDGDTLLVSLGSRDRKDPAGEMRTRKAEVVVYTRNAQGWQRTQDLEPVPAEKD